MKDIRPARNLNPYIVDRFGKSGVTGILKDGKQLTCYFCNRRDMTYDIGAMSPAFRCCQQCIESRGIDALRAGADEAVSALAKRRAAKLQCCVCHAPMIETPGEKNFVCQECRGKLPKIAQQARKRSMGLVQ